MFRQLIIIFFVFGSFNFNAQSNISLVDQSDCPRICPDNYDPICGSDGSTFEEFANACELQLNNCLLMEDKEPFAATDLDWCRTEKIESWDSLMLKLGNVVEHKTECSKICSKIYKPVCISNGQYRVLASKIVSWIILTVRWVIKVYSKFYKIIAVEDSCMNYNFNICTQN